MKKKTILHFIDNLQLGGAQTLMATYIPELKDYNHILVTFGGTIAYATLAENYKHFQIPFSLSTILRTVSSLKHIIKQEQVDIVHAHSFWTNIISRLATPRKLRLINHYHFADFTTNCGNWNVQIQILLERMTTRKEMTRIAVSAYVLRTLDKLFPDSDNRLAGNFVAIPKALKVKAIDKESRMLKCIAIGTITKGRNYDMMLEIFEQLEDKNISIDVFGAGPPPDRFTRDPNKFPNIKFCGTTLNVQRELANHSIFCSFSSCQSFGLVVLEAMSAGLPLLLHQIPAFNEVAGRSALYFSTKEDFLKQIVSIREKGFTPSEALYNHQLLGHSVEQFLKTLRTVYSA